MTKEEGVISKKCAYAASLLGDRWVLMLVHIFLYEQEKVGFNELQRKLKGISPKTLSTRLQELEEAGIINREISDKPLRVKYSLTDAGKALKPIAEAMKAWCEEWLTISEPTQESPQQ